MSAARLWPLVLGLVGGCFTQSSGPPGGDPPYNDYPPYYPPDDGGGYSGGGPTGYGCHQDSDCGPTFPGDAGSNGLVCARDGECLASTAVRIIHVTWTLEGQAASTATCATAPPLELAFADPAGGSQFGFAPVPCMEGKFTVDKMPIIYTSVSMGSEYNYGDGGAKGTFDATGAVALDLPY
jgi:hypothetical protein